jgi:hypothetical protein
MEVTANNIVKDKDTVVEAANVVTLPNEFTVRTNLKGRQEAFKMIALAEALGLPLLFLGVPGIGKTNCVRDYAAARCVNGGKIFILETDEYTRPAEVKGRPNLKKLAEENIYEVISPVVDKDFIIVNEIDKASGGMRNSFMSIMNERVLFTGEEEVPLKYKAFIGTCNTIPKDEKNSPFWDRFVLKTTLDRMTIDQLMDYFKSGHKERMEEIQIKLPTEAELSSVKATVEIKLRKLVEVCRDTCSDRTLTHLPKMVKAVAFIWSCTADNAFIKTAEILAGATAAKTLADQITTKEMKNISDKIDMIPGIANADSLKRAVHEINVLVTNYVKDKKITPAQVAEVEDILSAVLTDKGVDIEALRQSMGKLL